MPTGSSERLSIRVEAGPDAAAPASVTVCWTYTNARPDLRQVMPMEIFRSLYFSDPAKT